MDPYTIGIIIAAVVGIGAIIGLVVILTSDDSDIGSSGGSSGGYNSFTSPLLSRNDVDAGDVTKLKYMYPVGNQIIPTQEPFQWNIDYNDNGVVQLKANGLCLTHPSSASDALVLQDCDLSNPGQGFFATPYEDSASIQQFCPNQYSFKSALDGKYVGYGDNKLKTQNDTNPQARWCLSETIPQ